MQTKSTHGHLLSWSRVTKQFFPSNRTSFISSLSIGSTLLVDLEELLTSTYCGLQQSAGATKSRNTSLLLIVVAAPLRRRHVARAEMNLSFVSGRVTSPEIIQGVHWQRKQTPTSFVVDQRLTSNSVADGDVGTELGEVSRQRLQVASCSSNPRLSPMLWSRAEA